MNIEELSELLYYLLVGANSYPMRLRANNPPSDEEFGYLEELMIQAVKILKSKDYVPKKLLLAFLNIESGLSQGLAFYSDVEADRLVDWHDRIVAIVEVLYKS